MISIICIKALAMFILLEKLKDLSIHIFKIGEGRGRVFERFAMKGYMLQRFDRLQFDKRLHFRRIQYFEECTRLTICNAVFLFEKLNSLSGINFIKLIDKIRKLRFLLTKSFV